MVVGALAVISAGLAGAWFMRASVDNVASSPPVAPLASVPKAPIATQTTAPTPIANPATEVSATLPPAVSCPSSLLLRCRAVDPAREAHGPVRAGSRAAPGSVRISRQSLLSQLANPRVLAPSVWRGRWAAKQALARCTRTANFVDCRLTCRRAASEDRSLSGYNVIVNWAGRRTQQSAVSSMMLATRADICRGRPDDRCGASGTRSD